MLLTIAVALALAAGGAAVPEKGAKGVAADSSARDSADVFVPLAKRPVPKGLLISALVPGTDRLWAVGDSGLVAYSLDDSSFIRLENPSRAALHCADLSGRALVCAGDSGRVCVATGETIQAGALKDSRTVRALSMSGTVGLLGGDEGLLARTEDGGRTWRILSAPLPMRFTAVLATPEAWWAGGAGGRIFRSVDLGQQWEALPRLPHPLADLANAGAGRTVALDRRGGVHMLDAAARRSYPGALEEAGGKATALALAPWSKGWALCGDDGLMAALDTSSGEWLRERLDLRLSLPALCAHSQGLLAAGAWSSMAAWQPGVAAPRLHHHSLGHGIPPTKLATPVEPVAEAAMDKGAQNLPDSTVVAERFADTKGPRYFQNMLDTEARCSTVPTRMRQLERSYDNSRWVGVAGRAMMAVDVNVAGGLDSAFVLDEWPAGLGIGDQALQIAKSLSFTPGFKGSAMVASRLLMPITFPGAEADFMAWARGERQAGGVVDSLLLALPKAQSPLEAKALVKAMDFPRKAKRYLWEGAAVVEYRLNPDGEIVAPRVLWDSEEKYGFGTHALEILPKLAMAPPAGQALAPGDHLRVVQRLNFDRKRYDRARKESQAGFLFAPVLYSQVASDSSRYEPGLSQLEWLLNDFTAGTDSTAWQEVDLLVVLRQSGRVHEFQATPLGAGRSLDPAILRSLAIHFTWGHTLPADVDKLDTLALRWKPRSFKADSSNAPPGVRALLRGVLY